MPKWWLKPLLTWCAISIGAYCGTLCRYGLSYFKGGGAPPTSNFTGLLMANTLGSFVLGLISEWQAALAPRTAPRLHRIFYSGVASGFCGSLTTFSSWNQEAGKLFLQQVASSSTAYSSNGGRIFDWLLQLWIGFALPLMALRAGQHIAVAIKCSYSGKEQPASAGALAAAPSSMMVPTPLGQATQAVNRHERQASRLPVDIEEPSASPAAAAGGAAAGEQSDGETSALSPPSARARAEPSARDAEAVIEPRVSRELPVDTEELTPSPEAKEEEEGALAASSAAESTPEQRLPVSITIVPKWHKPVEGLVIVTYVLANAALIAAPVPTGWESLTLATMLGSVGAYLRYRLAPLNKPLSASQHKERLHGGIARLLGGGHFPLGTFIVNVLGTWILAVVTVLASTVVSQVDTAVQALLFGLSVGFCGCFTTMSTFALELHRLPLGPAYLYCVLSFAVAQLGWLLIVGLSLKPTEYASI